jgi:hypothetical protein
VSAAEEAGSEAVWTYAILPYDDFVLDKPPLYRDRESGYDQVSSFSNYVSALYSMYALVGALS